MTTSEQKTAPGGLEREARSEDRFATITCPSCQGTLRVKAHVAAAAPCPICQHPLRYDPPPTSAAAPAPAPAPPATPEPPRVPEPTPEPPKASSPSKVGLFNDFLNSPVGIAISWLIVAILVAACIVLFIQWNQERAQHSLRMETIQSQRPPASRPPGYSSVPLLPGEPAPAPETAPE